ncbi:MAG: tetratricopeptide repeat protein [Prevotella sp.]|nr:tetratricopeptide repeat protein [Prevotella sp.]
MHRLLIIALLFSASCLSAQTRQQWRDSLEVLNAKIGKDPNNLNLHLLKAEANINLEQWDYALAEYGKILHADEKNLAALYFRAYVHMQQKHYDLARVDYESFLLLEPEHFEARLGLAHVLQKLGRKTETTDELNRLIQMFPDSADAYAARAAYETELKQYDIALYDWDEAIRRKPHNSGFVVSKADILIKLYRMDEARKELNAAIKRGVPRYALKEWLDKCK